ncbi:MAG TPA: hypothetical protein VMU02_11565, partial [bacterium]|nr:hypothetical protein [bacterium]
LACSANISYGHRIARWQLTVGKQLCYGGSATLKPTNRLSATLSYNHIGSDDVNTGEKLFEQTIFRSKLTAQVLRELSARIVFQYDDSRNTWQVDPLVTYQVSPFSIFYIGSTQDYQKGEEGTAGARDWSLAGRQYFLKLQYLFQT